MIKAEISKRSLENVENYLNSIALNMRRIALDTIAQYLVGDDRHGLTHYPPYKYVSRKKAYGQTFVSDKQRKYVMAMIKQGVITPGVSQRTGKQANSWEIKEGANSGRRTIINTAPGSMYTMGNNTQANQPRLVGWRTMKEVIESNMRGAIRSAQQAINRLIKR